MDVNESFYKKLLEYIFENGTEGIVVINNHGLIETCNKRFLKILGTTKKKILGFEIDKVMPSLEIENNELLNYEIQAVNKLVTVRKKSLVEEGTHLEILFISENQVTNEFIRDYYEFKKTKEMYESILNSIDEGIHVADADGNMCFINPAQEQIDGLKAESVLGKHWLDIYELSKNNSLILKVLNDGNSILNIEQNYVVNNKKIINIVCSCMPIYVNGQNIGAVAITRDYIKYKEIAEKILNSNLLYNDKNKSKTEFKYKTQYTFDDISGKNKIMIESIKMAKDASMSESAVLIYGETGTGKEMYAQSIHAKSNRANKPFLAINCAAIPENLLEGILFGTTKGIYTGAIDRSGLLEEITGGTLFLDEINSMSMTLQSKLLRVIEEIENGKLRADLFYRLAVIYLMIPPLRNRKEDLDFFCQYYIKKYNVEMKKNVSKLSPQVYESFYKYHWPGNIRQLKHCIESAMNIIPDNETMLAEKYLPQYLKFTTSGNNISESSNDNESPDILQVISSNEKEKIISALMRNNGNAAKAAKELGVTRQHIHYQLKKYRLK